MKLIGFSIFQISKHSNSNFKFEFVFVFHFNLKNEKPNLLEHISYETSYQATLRNYNK